MSTPLDGATLLERADALAAITAGPATPEG